MHRLARLAAVLTVCCLPAACSLFGDDEEADAAAAEAEATRVLPQPVDTVVGVEIGRTASGFVITAYGIAPGAGFGVPQLTPRRQGRPAPDGFIEYDFRAIPPDPNFEMPRGSETVRRLRADRLVSERVFSAAAGIRIFALRNARAVRF
ncbi:MAG: hypothetical protein AAF677_15960 [Pseudomonadota bacterium]